MIRDRFLSFTMVLRHWLPVDDLVGYQRDSIRQSRTYMQAWLPLPETVWRTLDLAISPLGPRCFLALFSRCFRMCNPLEDDVVIGAAVTALIFTIGKIGIAALPGHQAASVPVTGRQARLIILLWHTFPHRFFGAEFTKVYTGVLDRASYRTAMPNCCPNGPGEKYRTLQSSAALRPLLSLFQGLNSSAEGG